MHIKSKLLVIFLISLPNLIYAKNQSRNLKNTKRLYHKTSSWGINPILKSSINLESAWKSHKKRNNVTVAVVDTGVDFTHPLIKNNLINTRGKKATEFNYGKDFSKGAKASNRPVDLHGHGTHISGIIKSVYPAVKILALKYYNPQAKEKDNLNSTIKALEYAVDIGVDIINYSSGGAGASLEELRVLKKAEEKGILVVAAAGNNGSDIDNPNNHYYPASYQLPNIITVINHDKNLNLNRTSNYGKKSADISAPGSRIKSSLPNGRLGYLTGTSQSTAFVSGLAALLKAENKYLKANDLKKLITTSAKKVLPLTNKCRSGGILNASGALELLKLKQQSVASKTNKNKKNKLN